MISTLLAIDIFNRQLDGGEMRTPAKVTRETDYFRSRIGSVETPDDLISDFRLYRYVMTAFDLADAAPQKALVKRVLSEDPSAEGSTAARLADAKFRELSEAFGFGVAGNLKLKLPDFLSEVESRYTRVSAELSIGETSNGARLAAYFDRKIPDAGSWYEILADKPMREVVFTALQMPDAMQTLDVDRLAQELERRFAFEFFQDAEKREEFIRRFAIFSDMNNLSTSTPGAGALSLLTAASRANLLL
ncbi:DUF1217 domain-containing protein [Parvularcula lutaonensis]|uniref:DUF1217 domain-containing protein n=1 Tax=Parvularcula lutaonensis TaxID=491923 RepID=A0ABV7MCM1_9PROT|nr:DUF1217 domain-containing protein [Parvularcula lutaonensis]GGY51205.1 hypothetical protein GCM10007148_20100 [Parvularcula lutaonensis]